VPVTDPTVPVTDPTVPVTVPPSTVIDATPASPTVAPEAPSQPEVPAGGLPETGGNLNVALAACLLLGGVLLVVLARRPRSV
jgi:LPXTG-motif cell wall-anchored protein